MSNPDTSESRKFLTDLFTHYGSYLVDDLLQCLTQQQHTTKLDRRFRALAYLLDAFTGIFGPQQDGCHLYPSEYWVCKFLNLITALQANLKNGMLEAKTALERTERRLRETLNRPELFPNTRRCVACDELYKEGTSHQCTNAKARGKDSVMNRDDTIL